MSEQERSDQRAPAADTSLPVVSSTASGCRKTSKDGAAKNGCSACGKCGRRPATEGNAGTVSSTPDGK